VLSSIIEDMSLAFWVDEDNEEEDMDKSDKLNDDCVLFPLYSRIICSNVKMLGSKYFSYLKSELHKFHKASRISLKLNALLLFCSTTSDSKTASSCRTFRRSAS